MYLFSCVLGALLALHMGEVSSPHWRLVLHSNSECKYVSSRSLSHTHFTSYLHQIRNRSAPHFVHCKKWELRLWCSLPFSEVPTHQPAVILQCPVTTWRMVRVKSIGIDMPCIFPSQQQFQPYVTQKRRSTACLRR